MIKDVLNTSPGKNKTIKNIKIALEHFFKRNKNKKHHTILLASLSLYVALFTIDICEFFEERSYVLGDIVYKTFNKSGEEEEELKITATSTSGIPKVRRKKTKQKNGNNANYYKKYEIKIFWKLEKTFPNHITFDIVRMISLNR